jgi:hypothetical protein
VAGFLINMASGSMFLMADPDQYVYNPAFHFKLLCMALAGLNVLLFYVVLFRKVNALGAEEQPPWGVKASGAASLLCWTGVIIGGRMLTFFRPVGCRPDQVIGSLRIAS